MIEKLTRRRAWGALAVCLAVLALSGCGAKNKNAIPSDVTQPDKFLFDRGTEAMMKNRWVDARQYFQRVVENYPNSTYRANAKLGVGDTYMGEGGTANQILAANEYREFLTFYPLNARADYAQYKLAMTHVKQMRAAQRDQSETREALKEFETFFERYPNSSLTPDARKAWRDARTRLSEASYLVGLHYYRVRWYPGALLRFQEVLKDDPSYPNRDDVYFYMGETYLKAKRPDQALPWFDRLVSEFQVSEHLDDAKKRVAELKAQADLKNQ